VLAEEGGPDAHDRLTRNTLGTTDHESADGLIADRLTDEKKFLPKSANGFRYLVQGRCSLTWWAEFKTLKTENAEELGRHLFDDYLCRWGAITEIVTDNGPAWIKALKWLTKRYNIHHIRISPYNSQANGLVERAHRSIRDALVKVSDDDLTDWDEHAPYVFWSDRITARKMIGMSPFEAATGIEPLLPLDVTEATFLFPDFNKRLSDAELIANRARQLERRDEDIEKI
jgi:transposase InsO family protein